jgi:hypothetical protein
MESCSRNSKRLEAPADKRVGRDAAAKIRLGCDNARKKAKQAHLLALAKSRFCRRLVFVCTWQAVVGTAVVSNKKFQCKPARFALRLAKSVLRT